MYNLGTILTPTNLILFMAILTIIAALFGLVLYRYTVLRYALICIGMIAGIKIALAALKKMKNN